MTATGESREKFGQAPNAVEAGLLNATTGLTKKMFGDIPVIPTMSTGATDGRFLRASGIPTYGVSGIFSAFECKRLNVIAKNGRTDSLAREYVINGMTRFVGSEPQYAIGLNQGGMIGYVMNGETEKAITAINKQVKACYIDLQMKSSKGLNPSSRLPNSLLKESLHHLPSQEFIIHHVFLPF